MKSLLMTDVHQNATPWSWPLAARAVTTLDAASSARWLRVDEGCVWVTAQRSDAQAEDIWLSAGDSLALPAGSAWVVEAWPRARLSLLQAPPPASRAASSRWAGWWTWLPWRWHAWA